MYHRFGTFVLVAAVVSLLLLVGLYRNDLQRVHQTGLKNWVASWRYGTDYQYAANNETVWDEAASEGSNSNDYAPLPLNSTHPRTTLVLSTMSYTDNSWVERELGDMLGQQSNLYTAFYVANDDSAPLHTPANKGHEAMGYLSYIIDFYDSLPDISIFMHGHPQAWHNNYLLDMSSSQIIRRLSREKIMRDGYMNLRCHWSPGCPDHLHPQATEYDDGKREELRIKEAWQQLFPAEPIPEVLSQPCCSQFAVTRERVHNLTKEKYIEIRDWLLDSPHEDYITGRIFEYLWQYMFNGTPTYCPDPRICYCDAYGVCFEDPGEYQHFFDRVYDLDRYRKELEGWEKFKKDKHISRSDIAPGGPDASVEGSDAREAWLRETIDSVIEDLDRRKQAAMDAGQDPWKKQHAINQAKEEIVQNPKDGPPWWTKKRAAR